MTTPSIETIPAGFCQCGCGQETTLTTKSDPRRGIPKGVPCAYVRHHQNIRRVHPEYVPPFKLDGHYCRLIALTKGLYTIVWEEDYAWLALYRWHATYNPPTRSHYAVRTSRAVDGKRYTIIMHREILGLSKDDTRQGDHERSGDTLDNRRDKLRICTRSQNGGNKRRQLTSSTGFKGVSRCTSGGYSAHIRVEGSLKYLGTRTTREAAHELYNAAALRYFGEFANDGENRCPAK